MRCFSKTHLISTTYEGLDDLRNLKGFQVHTIIQKSKKNMKKMEGIPGICSSSTYLGNSQNFSDEKNMQNFLSYSKRRRFLQ